MRFVAFFSPIPGATKLEKNDLSLKIHFFTICETNKNIKILIGVLPWKLRLFSDLKIGMIFHDSL